MKELLPEVLQFSIPFIFVMLIIAVAVLLAYTVYRQTNPQNSSFVRTFLTTLRSILLVVLLLLFFKPRIFLQYFDEQPKNIAFLIDHSASMAWQNENEDRSDSVHTAISQIENNLADFNVNLKKIYFNQSVINIADSLGPPFGITNFNTVINHLKDSNFEQAILLSDGIRTDGIIPQVNRIPIYTVGIGEKTTSPDIFITDVEYNPVVYQNKNQTINVKISNKNMPGSSARIFIYLGNKLITSKIITSAESGTEQEIDFIYKAQQTGLEKLRVELRSEAKDSNIKNNSFVFTQQVLKSKIQVGIFSSVPNNEHKFLKFLLSKSENIEIHSFIKIKNRPVERYPLDSLDVIILQGYPGRLTNQTEINMVGKSLERNRQGLIIILDSFTDIGKLSSLNINHITDKIRKRDKALSANVSPVNLNNLLLRIYDNSEQTVSFFSAVPPVISFFSLNDLKGDAQVLIAGRTNGFADEALMISEDRTNKMILLNGSGFWKWHFSLQRDSDIKDGYKILLNNIIRWAANKNKFKPVVLKINKKTVNPGQEITFNGHLFDAQNNPITKGQIIINARAENQKFTIAMEADSTGGYIARYTPASEGTFVFEAQGFAEGEKIGSDEKNIVVIPYNREFIRTNQDTSFLQLIAENSGGKYFNLKTLDSLNNHLDMQITKVLRKDEIELRFKSWFLYFTIAVAVLEWIVRKKNNLP